MCEMIGIVTYKIAEQNHECDACLWIEDVLFDLMEQLTFSEKRDIVKAFRVDNCEIKKDELYAEYQMPLYDDFIDTIREKIDIRRICIKHELYQY